MRFSHDGIKDSLTRLAAPPFFYEQLRRELSRSERSNEPFSLIRIVLLSGEKTRDGSDSDDNSWYEIEILDFSETLTRLSRSEDLLARIGEREFVTLVRGNESAALRVIERFTNGWSADRAIISRNRNEPYPEFQCAHLLRKSHESALEFMNRLDHQPLMSLQR
jgi:GGDEF domain-containing protein